MRGRDRVVATHFWYPPQLIPLVEVCGGPASAPDLVPRICEILREVGKEPVVMIEFDFESDTVSRLGMPDAHRH